MRRAEAELIGELLTRPLAERHAGGLTATGREAYREQARMHGLLRCHFAPAQQAEETRAAVLRRIRGRGGRDSETVRAQVLARLGSRRRRQSRLPAAAALAALLLAALWLGWWWSTPAATPLAASIATGRPELLGTAWREADGTRALLGPGARLQRDPADAQLLHLAQGRLGLRVRPRSDPLVIQTPHGQVRVLGTRLSVQVTEDATRVQVRSGSVQVRAAGSERLLRAGSLAVLDRQGLQVHPLQRLGVDLPPDPRHLGGRYFTASGSWDPALQELLTGCGILRLPAAWICEPGQQPDWSDGAWNASDPRRRPGNWAALANVLGADLWLELPEQTDTSWARAAGAFLRDALAPDLALHLCLDLPPRAWQDEAAATARIAGILRPWRQTDPHRSLVRLLRIRPAEEQRLDWARAHPGLIDGFALSLRVEAMAAARAAADVDAVFETLPVLQAALRQELAPLARRCQDAGWLLAGHDFGLWMSYNEDIERIRRAIYTDPRLSTLLERELGAWRGLGLEPIVLGLERMVAPARPTPVALPLELLRH
ncbi:MAG: FecR domain-containing protein [Planctomycetota bacterium]